MRATPVLEEFNYSGSTQLRLSNSCRDSTATTTQPGEDLPDGPEVICRVCGRGEPRRRRQVVPACSGRDDLLPLLGFVAQTVAERSPLLVGHRGALPTGVPVSAGPRVRLARGPAIEDGEAEQKMIGVRCDRRLPRHGPLRRRGGVDRVELPQEARITRVQYKRLLAGRAI